MIYQDNYELIDENLSDSNVGARKRKNIRNHSFIINGIINDTVVSKSKTIDLAILDYKQCFDGLSVESTTNDLYNVGVNNDHLNVIYESDAKSKIAVKTPLGLTKRKDVEKAVAQGEVISPLKCTVSVDSIAEEHVENLSDHLYKYKDIVVIPPLGQVDDQIGISNCGLDSALTTAHLNTQTNIKKLQFGPKKCHKMHIGAESLICPKNFIDTWTQVEKDGANQSVMDLVDVEGDKHEIELLFSDSYLGDVIQSDGKNDLNITERETRGKIAVRQITQMLEDLCLGSYYFEVANVLRASLLLSSLLSNSESWYNLSPKDIAKLEAVDESLLRKIFNAHSKTAKGLLYLESGNIPVRYILIARRLNFLWYILNEAEDSLLRKFFNAQCDNPVKGDWITTVYKDLEHLDLHYSLQEIQNFSKNEFKNIVKISVRQKAFIYLNELKQSYSKAADLSYSELELQPYLKPESNNSIHDKCFIFAARTKMLDIKGNFKVGQSDLKCRQCCKDEETQEHILVCSVLNENCSLPVSDTIDYQHINGINVNKMTRVSKILKENLKKLHQVHSSTSAATNNIVITNHASNNILVELE